MLSEFIVPVIIGAAPPADSRHEKALQMYGNGTIDYNGPDRLPPCLAAATQINQKPTHEPRTAATDSIIIIGSSSDDGACVVPARRPTDTNDPVIVIQSSSDDGKKSNSNAPLHKKATKKKRFFIVNSSDEEASTVANQDGDQKATTGEDGGEDYHEASGESCKRKAKTALLPGNVLKKPTPAPRKTRQGLEFKNALKWGDVSDHETDTLAVKGADNPHSIDIHPLTSR